MKKRILSFALVIGMLLTLLPAAALADQPNCRITTQNCKAMADGKEVTEVYPHTLVTFTLEVSPYEDPNRFCYFLLNGNGYLVEKQYNQYTFSDYITDDVEVTAVYLPPVPTVPDHELLWFESFEDGVPSFWSDVDADGDGAAWDICQRSDSGSYYIAEGNQAACSASSRFGRPRTPKNQLIVPHIDVEKSDVLTFSIMSKDWKKTGDLLRVYLMPDKGEDILLGKYRADKVWEDVQITMPVTGKYRIGFSHEDCTDCSEIILDAIGYWRKEADVTEIFTDVSNNWAYEGIQYCYDHGLMSGTSETAFSPNGTMTRGMFATVLWNQAEKPEPTVETPFTDFTKNYYRKAIAWAYENEIVGGTTPTTFAPDAPITREQVATILYRYAKNYLKLDVSASNDITGYPDYSNVSNYAKVPLSWANAEGIITGSKDGGQVRLLPGRSATRAQGAKILMVFSRDVMN